MAEFWYEMKNVLHYMRLEDKYWGLFLAGLFVLFYLRSKETKRLLVLACAASLVCICPLTAYELITLFPALEGYYKLWHMVPAGVVVCAALTLIFERFGQDRRRQFLFVSGMFVILFFAGEFAYSSRDAWNDDATFLGAEQVGTLCV